MNEQPNTLEVLVHVPTDAEATLIVQSLEERGIPAKAVGGFTAGFMAEAPGDVSILVRHEDWARAKIALATVRHESSSERVADSKEGESVGSLQCHQTEDVTFLCEECGNQVTFPALRCGHVETCPHCGSFLDVPDTAEELLPDEPAIPVSRSTSEREERPNSHGNGSRTSLQVWIEVLVVLSFAYVPDLFNAIAAVTEGSESRPPSVYHMLSLIIRSLSVVIPLLAIMAWSKDPWQSFGIVRPRWIVDVVVGCGLWGVAIVTYLLVLCLLPSSMLEVSPSRETVLRVGPQGTAGFFLLLVASVVNGFAEELLMRAYLIVRLERLLASTWAAVAVTTVLFASYHIYQGPAATISVAAIGLLFAVSFCLFRRLWPLCIAHAVFDVLAGLPQ